MNAEMNAAKIAREITASIDGANAHIVDDRYECKEYASVHIDGSRTRQSLTSAIEAVSYFLRVAGFAITAVERGRDWAEVTADRYM